jgi:16S rRNA (uracil1498-N3)-methyltransferase
MGLLKVDKQLTPGKTVIMEGEPLELLKERAGRVGDLVTIRDRRGKDFRGRVVQLTRQQGEALIFEPLAASVEPPIEIHLIQALPKKERLEWIIQKATELGVSSVMPCVSDHSITRQERDASQKKSHRWQAIATKAAQQSRRARVPVIYPVSLFSEVLEIGCGSDLNLILWEKESSKGMKHVLAKFKYPVGNLTLAVGPEGGFSMREIELARMRGFVSIGLRERILRTETAAIAAITIIQYELGDLG